MTINTNQGEMLQTIGVQTIRIGQLEAENAMLRDQIEASNVAREIDALQIKQLAERVKAERNGMVADVTG